MNQKYPVIPLMHCQYIVSIHNGINKCAGLFAKKLTASQKKYISVLFVSVFPCNTRISCGTSILLNVRETRRGNQEWIIQRHRKHWEKSTERRQTKHKKTITTKHTTQKTKKMNNIEHPALTEHCRIWNITPSPSEFCRLL